MSARLGGVLRTIRVGVVISVVVSLLALGGVTVAWGASAPGPSARARPATGQFSAATQRALTSIVASGMGSGSIPGVVVGVWVPGQGSFVRAVGISDLATRAALRLTDHFRIASITKSFMATAILRLVDQRRLSLRARLSRYVAGIPYGNRITVAELLDMTSGIYDYTGNAAVVRAYDRNPRRPFSTRDVVRIIRRHKPLFAPGTSVAYDNSNYYLLGVIAQKVTGKPPGQVIRTQILKPLGLTQTSYPSTDVLPAPFSRGYLSQPNFAPRDVTLSNPAFAGGAGAMISTLGDLKVWAKALATGSLLKPATHTLQLKTRALVKTPKVTISYGMGITDINGLIGHDGAILGYGSAMFYLPSRRATIVVLGNNNDLGQPKPVTIAVAIAAYLFPRQFPNGL
jgi:D-alanyl-D-alanine carboxypeptidase